MTQKLTRAEAAFARCMAKVGTHFTMRDVVRHGLQADYELARRGGFYQSAGIETSVKGDDWANTTAGRAAIAVAGGG